MTSTLCSLGLILLLLISEHPAKEVCISKTDRYIRMSCKKGVIYKPRVVESNGTCKNKECQGLSAHTLTKQNECYWKKRCDLKMQTFPISPMVTRCHTNPTTLTVEEVYCIKKPQNIIVDICKTDRFGALDKAPIIVRSHPTYPWDYNHDDFRKYHKTECQIRYSVKSEAVGNSVLAYSVDDIDIDSDNDDLLFKHDKFVYNVTNDSKTNKPLKIDIDRNSDVVLSFRTNGSAPGNRDIYGPSATKGGRGFIICLQVMTRKQYDAEYGNTEKSVCDKVIKKSKRIRAKRIKKGRRQMKKKIKGKKKKGKKG